MTYKKRGRPPKNTIQAGMTARGVSPWPAYPSVDDPVMTRSTAGSDMADTSPEATTQPVESAQANDQSIKQLLKAIYTDGAYGTKRSLQTDLEEIKRLIG